MIELQLPMPPSVNNLWRRSGTRIHKSTEYKAWLIEAGWRAREQYRGEPISGHYHISVDALRPDRRRRDLDNICAKALNDLLVSLGFVRDDSDCQKIVAQWAGDGHGIFVRVQPA